MKLLAIDGNSIINRAFYGIKLLTSNDGHFTNAVYGFLNIFIKLRESTEPDAIAVAFDLREPTFRHKMYDGYKANRKGMPPELAQQLPVLKEILQLCGITILEAPGWEADDILGTLAEACRKSGNECVIATGDRDSLQLVSKNVHVHLAATKMGKPETIIYDNEKINEDYGVEPKQLIEIKALMGDSSDNIPGVAGIGQKTAGSLIQKYKSVDYIYEHLGELEIRENVRTKLEQGKDSAFLSRTLGTIRTDAPVPCEIETYIPAAAKQTELCELLYSLELFKMAQRLGINADAPAAEVKKEKAPVINVTECTGPEALLEAVRKNGKAVFLADFEKETLNKLYFSFEDRVETVQCTKEFENALLELLGDEKIPKFTHDCKPLHAWAIRRGACLKNVQADLLLSAYILNPSSSDYSVERLQKEYSVPTPEISSSADDEAFLRGAAVLYKLYEKTEELIKENEQKELLHDIEIPLAEVLADMEVTGFAVDAKGIEEFGKQIEQRISEIQKEIYDSVGYEFNINSPKQLGEALFVKLELPAGKKTKSGFSTNAEVLEGLKQEHPVVSMVLEYRQLAKLKSTYCDGLLKVIAEDGRIHSTLNQTETRTGRISSTEPNLQNIPVRQELGRELRKFFVAADGCVLADADYSQIELRVLADIANDAVMIEAFNNDEDIHRITASQVFGLPPELVTPLLRSRAKAVNFGIVYGIGAFSLAKDIGVSRAEASKYIKDYLAHYSGVNEYMEQMIALAKEKGYCKTLFARRRYLPELTASNANLRSFGERVARNMPIQGTAADIIKIAMIRVFKRLRDEGLKAKLILQVHDELIVEAPEEEKEKAAQIVHEEMENACKMKVRLAADVNTGKNWYQAKG